MSHLVLMLIGALLPTLLVSRLILWAWHLWSPGDRRLIVAHAISLAALAVLAVVAKADRGALAAAEAACVYVLPQAFWCWVDTVRERWASRPGAGGFADGPREA